MILERKTRQQVSVLIHRLLCPLFLTSTLALSGSMLGCEDPPPNDSPTVIGSSTFALCERKEGNYALSELQFVIEDLQGSDTLVQPFVGYRNVSIPMSETAIPAPTSEELSAAKEAGQTLKTCSSESCRMQYSWTYERNDAEGGLIRCDATEAQVEVIIKDINGNERAFKITVMQEE